MAADEFVLQLIQKSLDELGYGRVADELGRAIVESRLSSSAPSDSIAMIEWFNGELRAGSYLTIESYLVAVLSNFDNKNTNVKTSNTTGANYQTVVLIVLYLVRRTSFFESLISSLSAPSTSPATPIDQNLMLAYLREKLMPSIDEEYYSTDEFPDISSDSSGFAPIFGSELLSQLTRESESTLLLLFVHRILHSKYFFGYPVNVSVRATNPLSELRSVLVETFLGKIFRLNDRLRSFDEVYNIPSNYLQTLIDQALAYQKSQNPFYLPPRTKVESNKRLNQKSEPFLLGKPLREMDHFFKVNYFPSTLIHSLMFHSHEVWFTRFSPSGRFLATGSLDGRLIIYDVHNNFEMLKSLESSPAIDGQVFVPFSTKPSGGKTRAVIYCCWDPDEQYIVSCSMDTVVRIWSVSQLHHSSKKRITRSMDESGIAATEDEFKLLSCFTLGPDIKTWTCEFLPKSGLNANSTRPQFIIGSPDKVLKAFDVDGVELFDFYGNIEDDDDNELLDELDGEEAELSKLRTDETKSGDVLMMEEDDNVVFGDEEQGSSAGIKSKSKQDEKSSMKKKLENNFNRINDLSISPDGKVLITANNDRQIHFYKIPDLLNQEATTKRLASITVRGRLTSCSVSNNGKYFLLSSAPEELQVWDISGLSQGDGKNIQKPILYRRFIGHSQSSYIVRSAFGYLVEDTDQEELVMSGSDDGYIYFWKLHTGQLITRIKGHNGLCNSVDWNRNGGRAKHGSKDYGKLWCSVGDDRYVKIWGPSDWS
ncbi:predicted protein [Scheffersomyces stipitis CBS 6054]|uniref:WD40 repeat-like protein n=1 Tax=Scheffersomyces stipitis (strain ATCC 58785 / CBS 6054 / NBRC 10063 / NRRL Y-11545) TaxID=322104 RepID=A3LSL3_PICST|nr:predicted protein [Scheffersomyces stipitis CBS 6054]ABN65922.2 predicted protein [Scheffersomyces stipitis CBS 6054]